MERKLIIAQVGKAAQVFPFLHELLDKTPRVTLGELAAAQEIVNQQCMTTSKRKEN